MINKAKRSDDMEEIKSNLATGNICIFAGYLYTFL